MTALSASPGIPICRNTQTKIMSEKTIASGSVLYVGGIICTNTSNQLVVAGDSTAIRFEGIFWPWSGQNMTGDGVLKGRCFTGCEVLLPCAGTVTAADRGAAMFAADDEGVTDVNTLGPQIGILVEMETSSTCWVRLSAPVLTDAS
jgi:hypothetical protein